jgi:hypothetical protein
MSTRPADEPRERALEDAIVKKVGHKRRDGLAANVAEGDVIGCVTIEAVIYEALMQHGTPAPQRRSD